MTEQQWLSANYPEQLLEFLQNSGKACERKLRLFAVACCRQVWHFLANQACRNAVDVSENYADGLVAAIDLKAASEAVSRTIPRPRAEPPGVSPHPATRQGASYYAAQQASWEGAWHVREVAHAARVLATRDGMSLLQCALMRDIFANPFRPAAPLASALLNWNGGAVVQLARAAYEARLLPEGHLDPARLAVLADALEEAGCTDAHLLAHRRGPGPHVRGCHAVDLILARA